MTWLYAGVIGGCLLIVVLVGRPRRLAAAARKPHGSPTVSVVIPARNEARTIPTLLSALAGQTVPPLEVIVVDDGSEDETGDVAERFGARVIRVSEHPAGWLGKTYACYRGAGAARGELLLFLDADVDPAPEAIAALTAARRAEPDAIISVQPYHAVGRPYEHLSLLFNVVLLAGMRTCTIFGARVPPLGVFGPCLLWEREQYHRLGGHAMVRDEVVEDVALGEAFRRAGVRFTGYTGGAILRFRMYPGGIGALVEGWTKNFARGGAATDLFTASLIAIWLTALGASLGVVFDMVTQAHALLTAAHTVGTAPGIVPVIAGAVSYLAAATAVWSASRRFGAFGPLSAAAYPLHLLFFTVVFLRSIHATGVSRRVSWKGRTIHLPPRPPRSKRRNRMRL